MPTVILSVDLVEKPLPAGRTFGGRVFALVPQKAEASPPPPSIRASTADSFCQFDNVPAGNYTASCRDYDEAGGPLGDAVTAPLVVGTGGAAPQTYLAASGISAVVG